MKISIKLALIAVGSVVSAAISAILIPMPYGAILAGLIGVGGGLWLRSFFQDFKINNK